jgi:putative acetyltransferase
MTSDDQIRPERPGDIDAIYALTARAFAPMPYAAGDEQDLINALRTAGALTLSLVAERAGVLVGHIAFSPMTPDGWFALGPVSTEPGLQKQGVGAALIRAGLAEIRARGAAGCALTGNPHYYARFGFALDPALCPPAEPAEYFMTLPFGAPRPPGPLAFHHLFYDQLSQTRSCAT